MRYEHSKLSKSDRRRIVQLRKLRATTEALGALCRDSRNPRATVRNEKKIVVVENRT